MHGINSSNLQSLQSATSVSPVSASEPMSLLGETPPSNASHNLVFIDARVADIEPLIAGLPYAEVFQLSSQQDGLSQISEVLSQYENVASLHIFAHGREAELLLGNQQFNSATLAAQAQQLQDWKQHFTADADILFYGCNVAAGPEGTNFVQTLSQLTETDIAASIDLTGSAALGGNWNLEFATGAIEAQLPDTTLLSNAYQQVLALGSNLVVNGSFENAPGAVNNNWTFISSLPSWTRSTGSTNIEVLRNFEGGASEGSNYLEMDSNANYGIAQNIATTAGRRYQISFSYSPDRLASATSNTLNVLWGGQQVASVAQSGAGLTGTRWQTFTYEVTTTTTSTRLEFRGAGTSDGNGALLDNIQVREILSDGDLTAPTASLIASSLTTAGGSSYDFTVTYSDDVAVNVGSLDNADIRITGPNSFNQLATLVSVNNSANGTPRTATYRIAAPGGTWDSADNGSYSVALQANQITDTSNNAAVATTLGAIQVNIGTPPPTDTTAPTASLSASNLTTAGGSNYDFTVTYSDDTAINVATLDSTDVRVTGPNSFNQLATLVSVNNPANGTPRTATYRIAAPGGTWDSADNGSYSVALQTNQVTDTGSNAAAATTLGAIQVNIAAPPPTDTTAPTASLAASDLTTAGGSNYDFTVTYSDNAAVNVASLDGTDIRVTGPNGFNQLATLVSVNNSANGTPRTATYRIAAPGGTWDSADNGSYSFALQSSQVTDTSNNAAAAATLGSIQVNIAAPPPTDTTAPTASLSASNLTTAGGSNYDFTVTYSDDTAINVVTLDSTDIRVTGPNSFNQLATLVSVNNPANGTPRTATYRIAAPGGTWDSTDNGSYSVALQTNQVTDTSSNAAAATTLGSIQVNIAAPPPTGTNLVLNGSFENAPGAVNNNWTFVSSLPSWIRTGGSANIEVLRNFEGGAAEGGNYLELDSDVNYSIAQDIATTAGQRYQLSFAYSPDRLSDITSNTMNVLWNGQQIATVAQPGAGLAATRWQTFTYEVTATGSSTRLEFQGAGPSDGNGALLDNIQLTSLAPASPTIALEQSIYNVSEAAGALEFAVIRSGDSSQAASIQYEISSGTAQAGGDFDGAGGTIAFAPGETRKTASIPIFNDASSETSETFTFLITGPVGAQLGTVRTATATILDDDNTALIVSAPAVSENAGNAVITLSRGNTATAASVNFATANGTAQAGSDFTTTSGLVSFAIGETTKTINIPLINDGIGESNETFTVNFSNPIGLSLTSIGQTVSIIDDDAGNFVRETFISGLNQPTAFAYTPNNQLMFILEKAGVIKVAQMGAVLATNFADLTQDVNNTDDRGALSIAIHPNFYNGSPYIYVAYTYDPPEAYQNTNPGTNLDDPDGAGNRPARVVRLTADASANYTRVVPNSQVVIVGKNSTWANTSRPDVNSAISISTPESGRTAGGGYVQDYIKTDSTTHTVGHMAFGADGALYITIGDGTSYNLDPRTASVQQLDSLSGKLLRIDPITGAGLSDNPFYDGNPDSNRSKVWNLGLRNTFRFTFKPGTSTAFLGDVGWTSWEEINVSTKGANYGWPAYEGGLDSNGNPVSLRQSQYDNLNDPTLEALYQSGQVAAPIFARSHSTGARAIIMGDFYDGNTFPSVYNGALFIADVNQGTVNALTINNQNQVTAVQQFATGVPGIVYLETGADGNLYYVDIFSGLIGRWRAV